MPGPTPDQSTPPIIQPLSIIAGSTLAAVSYGLIHDQLTIRLSPHYFTLPTLGSSNRIPSR